MTETTDDGADGPTDQALWDLIDDECHRRLVEERRLRQRRLQEADEALTFADVLGALGAHQATVTVRTTQRTLPVARIREVGRDYLALAPDGTTTHLVPIDRIASARPTPSVTVVPTVSRPDPYALDLAERLRELVGVRARIQVRTAGSVVPGELRRVGADVLIVERDDGTDQFIALAAVDEVVVA